MDHTAGVEERYSQYHSLETEILGSWSIFVNVDRVEQIENISVYRYAFVAYLNYPVWWK